jgi:hypothetical protein
VDRLLYGASPGKKLALRISEATGGQVSVWELLFPDNPNMPVQQQHQQEVV